MRAMMPGAQERKQTVLLLREWLYWKAGQEVEVTDEQAAELIDRRMARPVGVALGSPPAAASGDKRPVRKVQRAAPVAK